MAENSEWVVAYTRHKTQKRKTYHDGILGVQNCNSNQKKVLLYDDSRQLLDSRFLGKHETVKCGEVLEFDSAFVDIGDPIKTENNCMGSSNGDGRTASSYKELSFRQYAKCKGFGQGTKLEERGKGNLAPLDIKVNAKNSGTKEWHVLYTTQKNKKLKKYHDGILKLVLKEKQNQVILSSEDGNILEKKDCNEDIRADSTIQLRRYIIEVLYPKIAETPLNRDEILTDDSGRHTSSNEEYFSKPRIPALNVSLNKRSDSELYGSGHKDIEKQDAENSNGMEDSSNVPTKIHRDVNQILTNLRRPTIAEIETGDLDTSISKLEDAINESRQPLMKESECNTTEATVFACNEGNCKSVVACNILRKGAGKMARFQPPKMDFNHFEKHLSFPVGFSSQKLRTVLIPNKFSSFSSYRNIMISAIYEEINLILYNIADEYHRASCLLSHLHRKRPSCKHGLAKLQLVKKDGLNKGRLFYGCSSQVKACLFVWADTGNVGENCGLLALLSNELEQEFSCFDIDIYADCEVFLRQAAGTFSKKRRREDEVEIVNSGIMSRHLRLCSSKIQHKSNHSKGDLWIVSSDLRFRSEERDEFVAIGVSQYHHPSADGILEVTFLEGKPPMVPSSKAYALHGPCIQSEVAMLNILREMNSEETPLLKSLIQCPEVSSDVNHLEKAEKLAAFISSKYKLNSDQSQVVHSVAKWFTNSVDSRVGFLSSTPEICLVHGIFGSGKSYLLTVLVIYLTRVVEDLGGQQIRVLISAATNVAVDRILAGLLELGFTDFIRVGSSKRIAEKVLPFSVYTTRDEDSVDDISIKELQERLNETTANGRVEIEKEIKALKEGKIARRKERLKDAPVVGVTCYSTINPILKGNKFQICILDECSQMPEPLSLLPICQFGCNKLVAVGDPCQLPPALLGGKETYELKNHENPEIQTSDMLSLKESNDQNALPTFSNDLRRPLFVRLVEMGYEPIVLKTQYRCHPRLVAIPNEFFYGGKIINGCRETDRPPLLPGMAPVLFWDTCNHGKEEKDSMKGYTNAYEAKLVCELIKLMLNFGIPGWQIGVIVFYKAQANLVLNLLQGCSSGECRKKPFKSRNSECRRNRYSTCSTVEEKESIELGNSISQIQVSTVDAFQGMEKNIIILSCCRSSGLGFLSSPNRLNVALTRARYHLVIIGTASNLRKSNLWKKLLENAASSTGSYISMPKSVLDSSIQNIQEFIKSQICIINASQTVPTEQITDDEDRKLDRMLSHDAKISSDSQLQSSVLDLYESKQTYILKTSKTKEIKTTCVSGYTGPEESSRQDAASQAMEGDAIETIFRNEDVSLSKDNLETCSSKDGPSETFEPSILDMVNFASAEFKRQFTTQKPDEHQSSPPHDHSQTIDSCGMTDGYADCLEAVKNTGEVINNVAQSEFSSAFNYSDNDRQRNVDDIENFAPKFDLGF